MVSRTAILAGALVISLAVLAGPGTLPEPLPVRFTLTDGTRVTGRMTAWSIDEIDGSFGARPWESIRGADVWTVHRRVMDHESPADWINLGRLMLLHDDSPKAEQAFRRALALDETATAAIDDAREAVRRELAARRERDRQIEAMKLETRDPEAIPWPCDPWPPMSASEQTAATHAVRARARAMVEQVNQPLTPIETQHFLVFGAMDRGEMLRWGKELERIYRLTARHLGLSTSPALFWGKAAVLIQPDHDAHRLLEADGFRHLSSRETSGIVHCLGPQVFIHVVRQRDDRVFLADLAHQVVHGMLHRHETPHRLPPWANEGLADFVAAVVADWAPVERDRRDAASDFVRRQAAIGPIFQATYDGEAWPGPDRVGPGLGARMVELLIDDEPEAFAAWVRRVKSGEVWTEAIEDTYGVSWEHILRRYIQYVGAND